MLFIASIAHNTANAQEVRLAPVVVQAPAPAEVSGFGDIPARELPLSTTSLERRQIEQSGARRLADLTALDAAISDAYNAPGYWDFISVRGFTLDNRSNYRREGLPISAETTIALDNKERVEVLKGTSGIQAGVSAPGGLVNYVVKRPPSSNTEVLRQATLRYGAADSSLAAVDLGGRFSEGGAWGYRLNLAQERLAPAIYHLRGERQLFAAAFDWRVSGNTKIDAELEWSRQRQPSQPGFSLLGNSLPAPADPRLNLNNQNWSLPSEFNGLSTTVQLEHALGERWRLSAAWGIQQLHSNDRIAFPYGCSAQMLYDRFCSDGSFDLYDYRSNGERRNNQAYSLALKGQVKAWGASHDLSLSLLHNQFRQRSPAQAFNLTGQGQVDGSALTPPALDATTPGLNRDERSLELAAYDAIRWPGGLGLWLGARASQLTRASVLSDGSAATRYQQTLLTPWAALSFKTDALLWYASAGQGIETRVTPNLPGYGAQAGQPLPALKSRQIEMGVRGAAPSATTPSLSWSATLFRIVRPEVSDNGSAVQADGDALHQGAEFSISGRHGSWAYATSAMLLDASRRASASGAIKPINVPEHSLRAQLRYHSQTLTGLSLYGGLHHEGARPVLADNSLRLAAWTRWDIGADYALPSRWGKFSVSFAIDNLSNHRYWREAPTQFGHVYLYPGAPRSYRLSLQAAL